LQQEWAYVQRVTEDIDFFFSPLEEEIANGFLPSLFGESLIDDSYRRPLSTLPVKNAGLALPDTTQTANSNYKASSLMCGHLVDAMRQDKGVQYSSADHASLRKEVIAETRKNGKQKRTKPNCQQYSPIWMPIPLAQSKEGSIVANG
jgi:hypothetical protein